PRVDAALEPRHRTRVPTAGRREVVGDRPLALDAGVQAVLVRIEEEVGELERRRRDVELQLSRLAEARAGWGGRAWTRRADRTVGVAAAAHVGCVAAPLRLRLDAGELAAGEQRRARGVVDARGRDPALAAEALRTRGTLSGAGAGLPAARRAVTAEAGRPGAALGVGRAGGC